MDTNDLTIEPKPTPGNRCYTVQDLQDILGVGRKSVYRKFRTSKNTFTVNQEQRHGALGTV